MNNKTKAIIHEIEIRLPAKVVHFWGKECYEDFSRYSFEVEMYSKNYLFILYLKNGIVSQHSVAERVGYGKFDDVHENILPSFSIAYLDEGYI